MKVHHHKPSTGNMNLSSPNVFALLNATSSSLHKDTSQIHPVTNPDLCYIKPKVSRKMPNKPCGIITKHTPVKTATVSNENICDNLFTNTTDKYVLGQTLGFGAYAIVKLATFLPKHEFVAVKVYEKSKLSDPQKKNNVLNEIKILGSLVHPNIIKFKEAIETPKQIQLVMEYASGCSLWSYINKKPTHCLPEPIARRYFSQILSGIHYCHSNSIVHRDIKLENILLDSHGDVKIIDFGFATNLKQREKTRVFCGTPSYMAPEIVGKTENPGIAADVWALGVVLFVMLTGKHPFKSNNSRELYRLILKGTLELPKKLSASVRALICKMLQKDPRKRPSCKEIMEDGWMEEGKVRDCKFADVSVSHLSYLEKHGIRGTRVLGDNKHLLNQL
jgi:serine/threonine protein kinase